MGRTTETISKPFEVRVTREDDGRLVEVTFAAIGDAELSRDMLSEGMRELTRRLQREEMTQRRREHSAQALSDLRDAFEAGNGSLTDQYLANLAKVYAEGDFHRPIVPLIAETIGRPASTVKTSHLPKARQAGWLSEAEHGRTGGKVTDKTRELLDEGPHEA